MRGIYNRLLDREKGGQHFAVWGRGHFQVRTTSENGDFFFCQNAHHEVVVKPRNVCGTGDGKYHTRLAEKSLECVIGIIHSCGRLRCIFMYTRYI